MIGIKLNKIKIILSKEKYINRNLSEIKYKILKKIDYIIFLL